jgi:molybdenum cofactor cytidylyltransferase
MLAAIVPAAGKSTRMGGRSKLGLPLGRGTVLGHVVSALRAAEVDPVLVVVGPHVAELADLAEAAGARTLLLEKETTDMRATVEHGLLWLEANHHPLPQDRWLLVPADHPLLDPVLISRLVQARQSVGNRSIVVPAYEGRRGHPTLFDWTHAAGIRSLLPGLGVNAYVRDHIEALHEVPVESPQVLHDLDVPIDYERLVQDWNRRRTE